MRRAIFYLVTVILSFWVLTGNAVSASNSNILARVNKKEITLEEFKEKLKQAKAKPSDNQKDSEIKQQLLDDMIDEVLIEQQALKYSLSKDPQLQKAIDNKLLVFVLKKMYQDYVSGKIYVSGEEVSKFYEENKSAFRQPEQVKARHILVKVLEDSTIINPEKRKKRAEEKALKKIREIQKKLEQNAKFEDLAKEYSDDVATKDKGGDLGYLAPGRMVKEFQDVAFTLPVGEISAPVKTQFGYHLITVEDKKKENYLPLDERLFPRIESRIKVEKERARSQVFIDSLTTLASFVYNETVLNQPESTVFYNPWVGIVNRTDTVFFNDYVMQMPMYQKSERVQEMKLENKKDLIRRMSGPYALKEAAVKMGYFKEADTKKEKEKIKLEEIKRKIRSQSIKADYQPSAAEIEAYYSAHKQDYLQEQPLHVYHIIFEDSLTAIKVHQEILEGKDFVEMAKKYFSGEPEIKDAAYDLGYISEQEMPEEFFSAAAQLNVGEISSPVKTQWGYHLIKLVDKKVSVTLEQATDQIKNTLIAQKNEENKKAWREKLRKKAKIWINEPALAGIQLEPDSQSQEIIKNLKDSQGR